MAAPPPYTTLTTEPSNSRSYEHNQQKAIVSATNPAFEDLQATSVMIGSVVDSAGLPVVQTQSATTAVIYQIAAPQAAPVDDYLTLSIFAMFCCCFPFNVIGLIYSILAHEANRYRDVARAQATASKARLWTMSSISIGALILILYLIVGFIPMKNH